MAVFVVPDGLQVKLRWDCGGVAILNVMGARGSLTTPVTQAKADTLSSSIKSSFTSSGLAACMPPSVSLQSVGVRDVNTANMAEFIGVGASVPGTAPTPQLLPRNNAIVITLRTARAGRSYRGRVYLSGLDEAKNSAGAGIDATAETAAIAFINAVKSALTAAGWTMAILSPALPERPSKPGGTLPAKPAFATDVTSVLSRSVAWGSQRRRNARP